MPKGMHVDEAMKITRNNVADELDGLPPKKMHCSNLAADALHEAIKDYKSKKGPKKSPTRRGQGEKVNRRRKDKDTNRKEIHIT